MSTKRIACAAMLATLLVQSPLLASEKLVNIGLDEVGNSLFLDTATMGKRERGIGNTIKIFYITGSITTEMILLPSCADRRLWVMRTVSHANGVKLTENKTRQEVPASGTSPSANAIQIYCKSINAVGW